MSFGDGFSYPYKSIPKVFSIVLGFAILIAALVALAMNSQSVNSALLFLGGIVLVQALFLTGYGIRVIRHLMDGWEELPPLEIISDIGRGIVLIFAGILYALPLVLVLIGGSMLGVLGTSTGAIILMVIVMIVFGIYLSWGFSVGMVRYAAEESSSMMFDFGKNFSYVNSNIGISFSLTARQFFLGVIYAIAIQVVSAIYNSMISGMVTFRTDQNILILLITIGYILSTVLNLFQQFGNLHFMYQYAEQLGIGRGEEKLKHNPSPNPLQYDG